MKTKQVILVENPYFQTQQEVYKYLCEKEGNKVISKDGETTYYFESGILFSKKKNFIRVVVGIPDGAWYKPCSQLNWYDNIPEQGVLCWRWDNDGEDKALCLVTKYYKDDVYRFEEVNGIIWKNAEPLTEEEIKQYTYKEPPL